MSPPWFFGMAVNRTSIYTNQSADISNRCAEIKAQGPFMDWDDVRMFLAVARTGQILAASKRLGVNHATLSRRVTTLEERLKTRLLVRRTNGCDLTSEGEIFLHAAERMETEMLRAQASVGHLDSAITGTVRIGAPDGFGVSFLAPRLGRLIARYPELRIQLV